MTTTITEEALGKFDAVYAHLLTAQEGTSGRVELLLEDALGLTARSAHALQAGRGMEAVQLAPSLLERLAQAMAATGSFPIVERLALCYSTVASQRDALWLARAGEGS